MKRRSLTRPSTSKDSNREFARRMTILQTWSNYWNDYTTRVGEAYPLATAKGIIGKSKKISCPIQNCNKTFTTLGGLKYHYARCNIEKSYKCTKCEPPTQVGTRGELLRHMVVNHYDELPGLNDEQKEIADTYRQGHVDRSKKVIADAEPPTQARPIVESFYELAGEALANISDNQCSYSYQSWACSISDWEPISLDIDRRRFLPPEQESLKFKLTDQSWSTLRIGCHSKQTNPVSEKIKSLVFFTGGQVNSSAWLPKPVQPNLNSVDLIALAVDCGFMNKTHSYKDCTIGEGCVQFWSLNLTCHNDPCNLDFIVGHSYGLILDMKWCPLGASWQEPSKTDLKSARVGLLALACGDGAIRIISVPHTDALKSKCPKKESANVLTSVPIFRVKPIATLIGPSLNELCDRVRPNACTSLDWSLSSSQRFIVAGYANGFVALYDLTNQSPILYSSNEIYHIYHPVRAWNAHGAPVTGVAIKTSKSYDDILIASGSHDRMLKIWDPRDTSSCIQHERSPITKLLWDYRFRGIVTATDNAFTSFSNRVSYRYPAPEGQHSMTISTHRATTWAIASSQITSSVAAADGAGEVFVLPFLHTRSIHKRDRGILSAHCLYSLVPKSLFPTDQAILKSSIINQSINDANSNPLIPGTSCIEADANFSNAERPVANAPTKFLLPIDAKPVETYSDFVRNYGLEFVDYDSSTKRQTDLPESCTRAHDLGIINYDRPCDYPFATFRSVSWSPNLDSFDQLLSATQVGLCRINKVSIVDYVFGNIINPNNDLK